MVDSTKQASGDPSAERSDRESVEIYRMMVEHANEAILVAQDGMLRFVNPKAVELIGMPAGEITGKPFATFLHPEDRDLVSERHRRRLRGDTFTPVYPCRVVHPSGNVFWVEINAVLFSWEGKPATLIFLSDITSRRRAEEALRESEEKYRQLFFAESDAILLFYADTGEIFDVNDAALKMYGHSRDAFLSMKITDVSAEPDATRRSVSRTVAGRSSRVSLRYHLRKDGTRFPVETSTSTFLLRGRKVLCGAVRDISGRIRLEAEVAAHRDRLEHLVEARTAELERTNLQLRREIEERGRVEERLRRSELQYSTLVENSLTGIYIDQDETIVFANQRFAEIYGYTRGEILGRSTWDLVHPEDLARVREIRTRRMRGQDAPAEYEARGLTRNGETRWIMRRNNRIEYEGRPAILGNVVDVSERKRAEQELHKTNEELKSFVHVVTHDLKSPIVSIQGISARLLNKHWQDLGDKGRGYVKQVLNSARRMESLVSDLLTLSVVGRVAPVLSLVRMEDLVREVVCGFQAAFDETGAQWFLETRLPTVRCDRSRMYRVFENLLGNAVKFRKEQEAPVVRIGCRESGAEYVFTVRDNGVGIEPEHREEIFEMFFRGRAAGDIGGAGLGLAIVRRIVQSHGGRVWVESEKGAGACFTFTLPKSTGSPSE